MRRVSSVKKIVEKVNNEENNNIQRSQLINPNLSRRLSEPSIKLSNLINKTVI